MLFAAKGLPVVRPSDFSPAAMQRTVGAAPAASGSSASPAARSACTPCSAATAAARAGRGQGGRSCCAASGGGPHLTRTTTRWPRSAPRPCARAGRSGPPTRVTRLAGARAPRGAGSSSAPAVVGTALAVDTDGLRPHAGHRLRLGVRPGVELRLRLDGLLRDHQQRRQLLPARVDRRRLVEGRRRVAVRRQGALHRRLQRDLLALRDAGRAGRHLLEPAGRAVHRGPATAATSARTAATPSATASATRRSRQVGGGAVPRRVVHAAVAVGAVLDRARPPTTAPRDHNSDALPARWSPPSPPATSRSARTARRSATPCTASSRCPAGAPSATRTAASREPGHRRARDGRGDRRRYVARRAPRAASLGFPTASPVRVGFDRRGSASRFQRGRISWHPRPGGVRHPRAARAGLRLLRRRGRCARLPRGRLQRRRERPGVRRTVRREGGCRSGAEHRRSRCTTCSRRRTCARGPRAGRSASRRRRRQRSVPAARRPSSRRHSSASPLTGAHWLSRRIAEKYTESGAETSSLGFPVSDMSRKTAVGRGGPPPTPPSASSCSSADDRLERAERHRDRRGRAA